MNYSPEYNTLGRDPRRFCDGNDRCNSISRALNLLCDTAATVSKAMKPQNFTVVNQKDRLLIIDSHAIACHVVRVG